MYTNVAKAKLNRETQRRRKKFATTSYNEQRLKTHPLTGSASLTLCSSKQSPNHILTEAKPFLLQTYKKLISREYSTLRQEWV